MCWIPKRNKAGKIIVIPRKRIARKDMVVYKNLVKNSMTGPCKGLRYEPNVVQPKVELIHDRHGIVSEGYHLYNTAEIALSNPQFFSYWGGMVVCIFIIPEGTKYYKNETEIVAESCYLVGIHKTIR